MTLFDFLGAVLMHQEIRKWFEVPAEPTIELYQRPRNPFLGRTRRLAARALRGVADVLDLRPGAARRVTGPGR
ncbi:MAG: hypothetical protein ACRDJ5_00100 [Actinomycetota bacterium]